MLSSAVMKTGILLINLGTPKAPTATAVKEFLAEFLMDPYVIDIPWLFRWILVKGIILRTRPVNSAAAYQKIWQPDGSPLMLFSQALCKDLAAAMGADFRVAVAMRYGEPTILAGLGELQDCDKVVVLPLFPQYSLAATQSAIVAAKQAIAKLKLSAPVIMIEDFYNNSHFIDAYAQVLQTKARANYTTLFSYHGIPVKQIVKTGLCQAQCDRLQPCPPIAESNQYCYRAQCYATTRLLAQKMQLAENDYTTCFQSRLGRTPWIKPYTDEVLVELAQNGVKRLQVACPAFVADCLETLEEIQIRAKQQWQSLGGEDLILLPCLNADPIWVHGLSLMLKDACI